MKRCGVSMRIRSAVVVMVLATVSLFAAPAHAFTAFVDIFNEFYKWGDPVIGTGATVTWSFMLDTVTVDPNFRMDPFGFPDSTGLVGTSNITQLRNTVDTAYGAGSFDAAILSAFDTWSSIADINFVQVADPGTVFAAPGSTTPDIRIGAFAPEPGHSFEFGNAAGFAPFTGFADPLAGDIIFNLDRPLQIAPGTEGVTEINYFFGNDLEGLFLHELGHAIGLAHPDPLDPDTDVDSVMYVGSGCCLYINRFPEPDDIAGIQHIYGPRQPGDFDLDGDVDLDDFSILSDNYLVTPAARPTDGDTNEDRTVNFNDFVTLALHFGEDSADGLDVPDTLPEPGIACLLLAGCFAVGHRARH